MHKQIVSNIFWLVAEKIITIILVFYVEGVIARLLSQQDYGKWIYSVNLVLLLSSLSLIVGAEVLVPTLSKHKKIAPGLKSRGLSRFCLKTAGMNPAARY